MSFLPSPENMKIDIILMPAWLAGIEARKNAPRDIHGNLDSSTPC
jgi:hypothetical protein